MQYTGRTCSKNCRSNQENVMTTIQYQYFPKNQLLPEILRQVVDIFIAQEHLISSQTHLLHSNDVLHILSEPLMAKYEDLIPSITGS